MRERCETQRIRVGLVGMRWIALALIVLGAAVVCRAEENGSDEIHPVIVVSDLTEDGRKAEHPTKEKPVYYLPRVIGFQAVGPADDSDEKTDPRLVIREAAKALAKEGYLVATQTHAPTLILLFQWGSLKPMRNENGFIASEYEGRKITGLLAGQQAGRLDPFFDHELLEATFEDHYFVLIAAYDLTEYQLNKKKKLLWVTKMSTPMNKTSLEEVAPMLIVQGRQMFGREGGRPRVNLVPLARHGKVEAGPLKTIELIDLATPAPAPAKDDSLPGRR